MIRLSRYFTALFICLSIYPLTACTTQIQRQDGSIERQAVDLDLVRLMASASVASWAAATNGINAEDAEAVMTIMAGIDRRLANGKTLDGAVLAPIIKAQVPVRYQGLAMVMIEMTAYQLKKYGLDSQVPAPGSDAWKVIEAIKAGATSALLPYMNQKPT